MKREENLLSDLRKEKENLFNVTRKRKGEKVDIQKSERKRII